MSSMCISMMYSAFTCVSVVYSALTCILYHDHYSCRLLVLLQPGKPCFAVSDDPHFGGHHSKS